jgi:hypothetical protein
MSGKNERLRRAKAMRLVQASIPFRLVYGLFYPAVLGSGLVAFGQILWATRWAQWTKAETYFLTFVVVLFTASFVSGYRAVGYRWYVVVLDAIEICLVFAIFATTRVLVAGACPGAPVTLFWPTVLVAATIGVQVVWILVAAGVEARHKFWIFGARLAIWSLLWISLHWPEMPLQALCYVAAIIVVVFYVINVVKPIVERGA